MKSEWILPTILIVLQLSCAAVYASHGDWRKVIYWLAASVLIASVTY